MLNVGVVGYRHSGRDFHSYLITLTEGLDLHAVSTRDAERRRAAERERGVKTYSIIDALLEDDKVDLVVIATPHHTHSDLSIKAMNAGKHVVTDKVMCMNAAEAETMIAASKRNKRWTSSPIRNLKTRERRQKNLDRMRETPQKKCVREEGYEEMSFLCGGNSGRSHKVPFLQRISR